MKTEFIDVSDTRKNLVVEIPSTVVDAEIEKIARDYSKAARIPGFRPGKVPPKVVRQRFRDQILHDVAHGLIPRAVDEALRERGVEPVDTPDIKDVVVEEGQPLKFTATFETVPPIDPGDYASITLTQPTPTSSRTARWNRRCRSCASGRRDTSRSRTAASETGDSVVAGSRADGDRRDGAPQTDKHDAVSVDIGAPANPPGFDEALIGLNAGDRKSFDVSYPDDYAIAELAGIDGEVRRVGEGDPQARRSGSGRRVRQGPRELREPRRRCGHGCAPTSSTSRCTRTSARCAASCSSSSPSGSPSTCRRRCSNARSTGASRSSSAA